MQVPLTASLQVSCRLIGPQPQPLEFVAYIWIKLHVFTLLPSW